MSLFTPLYPAKAAHRLRQFLLAGLVAVTLAVPLEKISPTMLILPGVVAVAVASAWVAISLGWLPDAGAWTVIVLGGASITTSSAILTHDAGASGLVGFLILTVMAAGVFRPTGAPVAVVINLVGLTVVLVSVSPLSTAPADGVVMAIMMLLTSTTLSRAVAENAQLVSVLEHRAAVDPLTGLVTRRVLDEAAAAAVRTVGDSQGCALIIIDLDHFKTINDTLGHPAGDAALTHVAELIRKLAPTGAVTSRLGGDELAILVPATSARPATELGHRVVDLVTRSPLAWEGTVVDISVSVGVAHSPTHAQVVADLYRAADEALYEAKRQGRGRSVSAQFKARSTAKNINPVSDSDRRPVCSQRSGLAAEA